MKSHQHIFQTFFTSGAITIVEREADAFDEEAVKKHVNTPLPCGCPGTHAKTLAKKQSEAAPVQSGEALQSQLAQWPCQLKLVPVNAPYFKDAHLLIAADCTAFAYANMHQRFMRNKITLIGCPKLDDIDYSEKLTAILKQHDIKSVTVIRMEVPCCGGIALAVRNALENSGKTILWSVITVSTDGNILE